MKGERRAHYMLRRTLPIWKPGETIEEAVEYCREYGIGEVIWKIDAEDFSRGHPAHAWIADHLPWLEKARDVLGEHDILSSINPWVTLNHCDRGRNQRGARPDWRWMTDADGTEANSCPCPLSEAFLAWIGEAYRLYASTRPHVLWLEDDLRTHGHQPVRWGCYCDLHMKALGERLGEAIAREELVARLLAPGAPDPARAVWFDVLGESMVGVARAVGQAVAKEHPETQLGLMCSLAQDGSWWADAMAELGACAEPVARPGLGGYAEGRVTTLLLGNWLNLPEQVCCLPEGTRLAPELEDFPYTPYAKSARTTRVLMGIGQLLGACDVTMNLYDHVGTPMRKSDRYGAMLKETRPLLDALAERCGPGGRGRGVGIPCRPNFREYAQLEEGQTFEHLASNGKGWTEALQGAGFPVVWRDDARVTAMTGQTIRGYGDEEVRAILSRGALVDASALATLDEMGFGELLGMRPGEWISKIDRPLSAEELHDADFGGAAERYLTLTGLVEGERMNVIEPSGGARVISHCVDPDHERVLPCFTVFENALGGRVAVYPFDLSQGTNPGFMNWTRADQIAAVVRWLGGGCVDLHVEGGAWMIPFRRDYEEYVLVAAVNVELDDWDDVAFTLAWDEGGAPGEVLVASAAGRWEEITPAVCELRDGELRVRVGRGVRALDLAAVSIRG